MWYWVLKALLTVISKLFFRFKVTGLKNIPKKTNFIVVANHASFLDPLLIMVAIPKKIYCIASRYLYKVWWIGWFLKMTEAFPSGGSSEKAVSLLMENKVVGLFPEGGISRNGKLKSFRRGASLLAVRTGRPIVPCAVLGSYQALPVESSFPKLFSCLKVKIGRPVYVLKEFDEVIDDILLQEITYKIRNAVKEMIDAG